MAYAQYEIIDYDCLNENTMNDPALQRELFDMFFDQSKVYISELQDALENNDKNAWHMTSHGVKGISRALGLKRLEAAAADCEGGAFSTKDFETLTNLIVETQKYIEKESRAA